MRYRQVAYRTHKSYHDFSVQINIIVLYNINLNIYHVSSHLVIQYQTNLTSDDRNKVEYDKQQVNNSNNNNNMNQNTNHNNNSDELQATEETSRHTTERCSIVEDTTGLLRRKDQPIILKQTLKHKQEQAKQYIEWLTI